MILRPVCRWKVDDRYLDGLGAGVEAREAHQAWMQLGQMLHKERQIESLVRGHRDQLGHVSGPDLGTSSRAEVGASAGQGVDAGVEQPDELRLEGAGIRKAIDQLLALVGRVGHQATNRLLEAVIVGHGSPRPSEGSLVAGWRVEHGAGQLG